MSSSLQPSRGTLVLALAVAGAVLPIIGILRSQGAGGLFADWGLLKVVWGLSPFLLFPLAARRARRAWLRGMILILVTIAVLFSTVGYLVLLPRRTGSEAILLTALLPVWQWPMALLSAALSVFVPSEEQEREMSGQPEA
ncbi:MAG: hypothetical protein KIT22_02965 [Verrucomicrobiae bacterium]|nr:hypothetical protein [Verrucomicrobiae bacterium]